MNRGIWFLLALLSFSTGVAAQPPLPHSFYGSVYVNNSLTTVGSVIEALDQQNNTIGTYNVQTEGLYGFLHAQGDDPATPQDEGPVTNETIVFRVDGRFAEQFALWTSGKQQNLTLTVVFSTQSNTNATNQTGTNQTTNSTNQTNQTNTNQTNTNQTGTNQTTNSTNPTNQTNTNQTGTNQTTNSTNQTNQTLCDLTPLANLTIPTNVHVNNSLIVSGSFRIVNETNCSLIPSENDSISFYAEINGTNATQLKQTDENGSVTFNTSFSEEGNATVVFRYWNTSTTQIVDVITCIDADNDGTYSLNSSPLCGVFDCNDDDNTVFPNATELCDGKDNSCNGFIDQIDVNTSITQSCGSDVGACSFGIQTCTNATWNACNGAISPDEEVCDSVDNDCDGKVDEDLGTISCGTGVCRRTVVSCIDGSTQTCAPGSASAEVCDGSDNDCDGLVDEAGVCSGSSSGSSGYYSCNERWGCTPWEPCADGEQNRICKDLNRCGTTVEKPKTAQKCSSSSSSSPSGTPLIPPTAPDTLSQNDCTPEWSCSEFSACTGGTKTRECNDQNKCNSDTNKPIELELCTSTVQSDCQPNWVCTPWSFCANETQERTCLDVNECNVSIGQPNPSQACETPARNSTAINPVLFGLLAIIFATGFTAYKRILQT